MLDTKGRANNRKLQDKNCAQCGLMFRPYRISSAYCSVPCARVKNGGNNRKDESWWINPRGYMEGRVLINGVLKAFKQHRYLMAKHLGRDLLPSEDVHHINGIKTDNRIENLEVIDHGQHTAEHHMNRAYPKGYRLEISDEERKARSERMKSMRAAAIAAATREQHA